MQILYHRPTSPSLLFYYCYMNESKSQTIPRNLPIMSFCISAFVLQKERGRLNCVGQAVVQREQREIILQPLVEGFFLAERSFKEGLSAN